MTDSLLRPAIAAGIALVLTLVVGWVADRSLRRVAARHPRTPLWPLLRRCRLPLQLTVVTGTLTASQPTADLTPNHQSVVQHALLLVTIGSTAWLISRVLTAVVEPTITRYAAVSRDYARVRRVRTQATLIRRVLNASVTVLALAIMLMTFPQARTAGTSMLASAGVLGIVIGIGAQSTLGNVFAGMQIALDDSVRIGDVVVYNGEWGTIEEITLTYVVLLTWDERRIVMPVSKFAGESFENWSRRDPRMTGTVFLHLDHRAPVDELRAELRRIVEASAFWDGRAQALQVTDSTPSTILLRALMTAKDAEALWELRCEVREKLIAHIAEHHPYALPRITTGPAAAPGAADPAADPAAALRAAGDGAAQGPGDGSPGLRRLTDPRGKTGRQPMPGQRRARPSREDPDR
ncbi:mechanosensitive ion channel family protein [Streptomyces capparidis]